MKINSINNQYQYNAGRKINKNASNVNNNPSFGGVKDVVAQPLSKLYDSVAGNGKFQKFVSKFSRTNSFTHLMVAESCFLSGFYMINTLRNKKIKKEQKPQMLINDALTLGVSTAGAYLLDDKVSNVVTKVADKYFANNQSFYVDRAKNLAEKALGDGSKVKDKVVEVFQNKSGLLDDIGAAAMNVTDDGIGAITKKLGEQLSGIVAKGKETGAFQITGEKLKQVQEGVTNAITSNKGKAEEAKKAIVGQLDDVYGKLAGKIEADKIMPGINKIKTVIIFGLIYRYLGPVLVTPLANKLSSKFFDKKNPQEPKQQEQKTQKTK